jgi:2-oxoglutarate ferredoxin oxidoreductase subunit alpha
MLEDVRASVKGRAPISFYGRMGGVVPFPDEILREIHRIVSEPVSISTNPRDDWYERMVGMR